ncbi:MAG: hypothetical protein IPH65_17735 [Dehalococcoidia bacterium]|nr:hypothetical protein [Dehalococcoidia bacterium]
MNRRLCATGARMAKAATSHQNGIAFGHTRVAIIDLSAASDQPFIDDEAGLALSFNGEI